MASKWRNTAERYGLLSISLHWLMLLLIIAVYATMELRDMYPKGSAPREALKTWHYMLGLSVFGLVWLRLGARLSGPRPVVAPAMPASQAWLAKGVHLALYVLMIGLPLLGWLILSANGAPVPFWGLELPALIGKNKDLARLLKEIHETVANAGYFLIGLHAAAALFHHYVTRDNTMRLMVPARRR